MTTKASKTSVTESERNVLVDVRIITLIRKKREKKKEKKERVEIPHVLSDALGCVSLVA